MHVMSNGASKQRTGQFVLCRKILLFQRSFCIMFGSFSYYLYQWPLSMTIIVVISILITLCTCTVLIWLRDVLNDFEERRAMRLQSRRGMQQQQQPRGGGGARTGHRAMEQQQRRRGRLGGGAAETVGASTGSSVERESNLSDSQTGESLTSMDGESLDKTIGSPH